MNNLETKNKPLTSEGCAAILTVGIALFIFMPIIGTVWIIIKGWDNTPIWVKMWVVTACDRTAMNAVNPSRGKMPTPTVIITLLLKVSTPRAMNRPPKSEALAADSCPEPTYTPETFATLLLPRA